MRLGKLGKKKKINYTLHPTIRIFVVPTSYSKPIHTVYSVK